MATRKRDVVVKKGITLDSLQVYADPTAGDAIPQVEGVLHAHSAPGRPHFIIVDPRYDIDEVAADIEEAVNTWAVEQTEAIITEAQQIIASSGGTK